MTPSFLTVPSAAPTLRRKGLKDLAMFGLRKAFVDPAPRAKRATRRLERFLGDDAGAMDFWVPE